MLEDIPVPNPAFLPDLRHALLAEEMAAQDAVMCQVPHGASTGFPSLDQELGGFLVPGLHILTGAPGQGKTAAALQIAVQCGVPCLYASSEMRRVELLRRLVALETGIEIGKLRDGNLYREELETLVTRASAACPMLALYDVSDPQASVMAVEDAARAVRDQFQAIHMLLVVDSLTEWSPGRTKGLPDEKPSDEAALIALKGVATRLSCPLLATAHQERSRQERSPYSAGALERIDYIAESLWHLEQPAASRSGEQGQTLLRLTILKNRYGPSGKSLAFEFDGRIHLIRPVA
ncbi:MAG: AAA family ATPase [Armatimonadetes bacterium]|nr:AAA family ATPase [Armatimonadota bacterium]